jgi:nucleoside diphosphate kinase
MLLGTAGRCLTACVQSCVQPSTKLMPVRRAGHTDTIRDTIIRSGFDIVRERRYQLTLGQAVEFYKEHEGKPFFTKLVAFMASGDIIALELEADGAIAAWRKLCGPTNAEKAKQEAPESLRAQFGSGAHRSIIQTEFVHKGWHQGWHKRCMASAWHQIVHVFTFGEVRANHLCYRSQHPYGFFFRRNPRCGQWSCWMHGAASINTFINASKNLLVCLQVPILALEPVV